MKSHDWKLVPVAAWPYMNFICSNCGARVTSDKTPEGNDGRVCAFLKRSSSRDGVFYVDIVTSVSSDCEEQNMVEIMKS